MARNRSNCYVFGIIGKVFENATEWWGEDITQYRGSVHTKKTLFSGSNQCRVRFFFSELIILEFDVLALFSSQAPISFRKCPSFSQIRGVIAHRGAAK